MLVMLWCLAVASAVALDVDNVDPYAASVVVAVYDDAIANVDVDAVFAVDNAVVVADVYVDAFVVASMMLLFQLLLMMLLLLTMLMLFLLLLMLVMLWCLAVVDA